MMERVDEPRLIQKHICYLNFNLHCTCL